MQNSKNYVETIKLKSQAITYSHKIAARKMDATTKAPVVAKEVKEAPVSNSKPHHITTLYKVTAYCPCVQCCGKSDGITATGTKAVAGRTIAVDPSMIPLGTKVLIGGKTFVAEDTGGAIKGRRIDMFFSNHKEAERFGVQNLPVVIIGRT